MLRNPLRSRSARWLAALVTTASAAALLASVLPASPASAAIIYTQLYGGYEGPIYGYGGQCLDDRGGITANLNPIELYPCNRTAAQRWKALSQGSGFFEIVLATTLSTPGSNPMCLDAKNQSLNQGTLVELYQCNAGSNQIWQPQPGGALDNQYSGSNACLDDPAFSTSQAQLVLWSCNGGANQVWLGGSETIGK